MQQDTGSKSLSPLRYLPLLAAIVAITPLAIDMYLPAMPEIASALQSNAAVLQQSLSVYLAAYALGMALFGPLADHFGRRRLLLIGLSGFALCSLLLSQVNSAPMLLILRALQALAGGAATVVVPATVRLLFKQDTAKGMSYVSITMMIAPLIAPALGSSVLALAGWRWIFIVIAGYAIFMLLVAGRHFPSLADSEEKRRRKQSFHLFGVLKGNYFAVLSVRAIYTFLSISVLSSFIFFTYLTAVSFLYMEVFGITQTTFSLLFAMNVIGLMSGNFINARLVGKFGSKRMLQAANLIALVCAIILLFAMVKGLGLAWCVSLIIPIMGCVMIMINNADAMILLQFKQQAATASAVIGSLRFASGGIAGPVLALSYTGTAVPFAAIILSALFIIAGIIWLKSNT